MTSRPGWARERAYYAARTMRVLELLSFGEYSSNEIAATLGCHPRTARRVLNELAIDGYLVQGAGRRRRYRATLRVPALGRQAIAHHPLPRAAAPWVAMLAEQTGLTAHLWIPAYHDVVCILHAHPAVDTRRPEPMLRELSPAHASAGGKALLAHRRAWREDLLSRPLARHTPQTLTDPRDLLADLDRARRRGCGIDHAEHHPETHAIAAPVFCADEAIAALGLTLTTPDHDITNLATLPEHVTSLAAQLTTALNSADP